MEKGWCRQAIIDVVEPGFLHVLVLFWTNLRKVTL